MRPLFYMTCFSLGFSYLAFEPVLSDPKIRAIGPANRTHVELGDDREKGHEDTWNLA